jgi:iron complex outermembrane receptor protein
MAPHKGAAGLSSTGENVKKKLIVQSIALLGTVGWSEFALAQMQAADAPIERVIVTGSNLKRTSTENPSLVQVISKKEIEQSGAVSVADLMAKVPALGSSNQVDSRDGGFSKGLATASLRNLGSASTLVLINGRRMSPAAYADPNAGQSTQYDLNSIPLSALERVEILKDGGSAVYGSDAIAGVINFITKSNFKGGDITAQHSQDGYGNFGRNGISGAYGFGDLDEDRFNAFVAFDFSRRDRTPIAEARAVHADQSMAMDGRLSNFYSSVSQYPVFFKESRLGSGSFNRYVSADLSCNPADIRTGSTALVPMLASDVMIGNKFCNYDGWQYEDAQGKAESSNVLARGEFKIDANMRAFAEASYSKSELEYAGVSRTLSRNKTTVFPKDGPGISFQPILGVNHPDNPTRGTAGAVPVAVNYRFTDAKGGSSNENTSTRLLAGLKGSHMNWDWDTGLLYNESKRHQVSNGFLYLPIVQRLVTDNVPLKTIASTPGVTVDSPLDGKASITQWDFKGSTELGQLAGGAIGLALGGEIKQEKMSIVPDARTVNGQIIGLANQYSQAKRDVRSVFSEVRLPVLKSVDVELAGRYDKYDGFSGSFTPKAGVKWTVSPTLAVRGTYSEGFRAPSLTQMVDGGTQYFLNNFEDKLRCGKPGADATDCLKSLSGVAAANKDLVPETSKSFTAGLIFSPVSNFDILFDYYNIRKEKETDLMSAVAVIQDPKLASRVKRDQNQGTWLRDPATGNLIPNSGPLISIETPYINAGGTRTSGIDLELALRNNLGAYGKLASRLNASYTLSYKKAQADGDPMIDLVGTNGAIYNDTTSVGEIPRLRASLSSTWSIQQHSLTATANYISSISMMAAYSTQEDGMVGPYDPAYCEYGRANRNENYLKFYPDCKVKSMTTLDLAYAYTGLRNTVLSFNVANVFNTKAPYDPSYATAGYNSSLHSARGRFFTVKANYKF